MNKKLLKGVAALFAVAVLAFSCSEKSTDPQIQYVDRTNTVTNTVTVSEREVTEGKLALALIGGLSGADAKGIPLDDVYSDATKFASVNSITLEFSVDGNNTLIATVKVAQTTYNTANTDPSNIESHLQTIIGAEGSLTKALAEIGVNVTEDSSLTFTKDSTDDQNKTAKSGDIVVSLASTYKLKVDGSTALEDLTSLEKLVVVVKFLGDTATWQ